MNTNSNAGLTVASVVQLIAEQLGIDEAKIPTDRPIGELGIDSLTAAQISASIEERLGTDIPLQLFLGDQTRSTLVLAITQAKPAANSDNEPGTEP
jgi:acyl carrier protein